MSKKKLPYFTNIERKHKRTKLDKAVAEYLSRQAALSMAPSKKERDSASVAAVARKFGIGRTTLGYYIQRKLK